MVTAFVLLMLLFLPIVHQAQISHGGTPLSFEKPNVRSGAFPNYQVASLNNDSLLEKDPTHGRDSKDRGFNFGYSISINRNLREDGMWEILLDSSMIGRLGLKSPKAYSCFLVLDSLFIPEGGELFVYTEDRKHTLGSFTHENMNPGGGLSIGPILGESVVLEYNQPQFVDTMPKIVIGSFVHVFKKVFLKSDRLSIRDHNSELNASLACHNNVQCPAFNDWCNERRSVAMVAALNPNGNHFSSFCSGGLLTNIKRDRRPYFLSAFHCANNDGNKTLSNAELNNINDWIFIFNYQTDNCADPNNNNPPSISQTISGADYLSGYFKSDFLLLHLFNRPEGDFNSYYSGWDSRTNIPGGGALIHHPQGDIKKISLFNNVDSALQRFGSIPSGVKSWRVDFYDGTSENSSSGGLAFNDDHRVIAQLTGGPNNNCDDDYAFLGRFDKSWTRAGAGPTDELRAHLSDITSNLVAMSGDDNCASSYTFVLANDLHTSANVDPNSGPFPGRRTYDGRYLASNDINAGGSVTIQSGTSVEFEGDRVVLHPNFHAEKGSDFEARADPCLRGCNHGRNALSRNKNTEIYAEDEAVFASPESSENSVEEIRIKIQPNPNNGNFSISFIRRNPNFNISSIKLYDSFGRLAFQKKKLKENDYYVNATNLSPGIYFLNIVDNRDELYKKKVIVEK